MNGVFGNGEHTWPSQSASLLQMCRLRPPVEQNWVRVQAVRTSMELLSRVPQQTYAPSQSSSESQATGVVHFSTHPRRLLTTQQACPAPHVVEPHVTVAPAFGGASAGSGGVVPDVPLVLLVPLVPPASAPASEVSGPKVVQATAHATRANTEASNERIGSISRR